MKITRSDGLAWRKIDGETFVVDLRKKWMFGLNRQGSRVWQGIVDGEDLETIIARVAMMGDETRDRATVRRSVAGFLRALSESGLVCELPEELLEIGDAGAGDAQGPAMTWNEELKAFAQSCQFEYLNCADTIPTGT